MQFPIIDETTRLERLATPTRRVQMVLDTDTYNEIDDQFAIVYALLSPEQLDVRARYDAPFHNKRSKEAADGMGKSYQEILRVLSRINVSPSGLVHKGSEAFLNDLEHPCKSEAALDLIDLASFDIEGAAQLPHLELEKLPVPVIRIEKRNGLQAFHLQGLHQGMGIAAVSLQNRDHRVNLARMRLRIDPLDP